MMKLLYTHETHNQTMPPQDIPTNCMWKWISFAYYINSRKSNLICNYLWIWLQNGVEKHTDIIFTILNKHVNGIFLMVLYVTNNFNLNVCRKLYSQKGLQFSLNYILLYWTTITLIFCVPYTIVKHFYQ